MNNNIGNIYTFYDHVGSPISIYALNLWDARNFVTSYTKKYYNFEEFKVNKPTQQLLDYIGKDYLEIPKILFNKELLYFDIII